MKLCGWTRVEETQQVKIPHCLDKSSSDCSTALFMFPGIAMEIVYIIYDSYI
jgi:hypothetical protein